MSGEPRRPTMLRVTADHIARGEPESPCGCPIALALRERFPDLTPSVGGDHVDLGDDWMAWLPAKAMQFVDAFDKDRPVQPVTFLLRWETWDQDLQEAVH